MFLWCNIKRLGRNINITSLGGGPRCVYVVTNMICLHEFGYTAQHACGSIFLSISYHTSLCLVRQPNLFKWNLMHQCSFCAFSQWRLKVELRHHFVIQVKEMNTNQENHHVFQTMMTFYSRARWSSKRGEGQKWCLLSSRKRKLSWSKRCRFLIKTTPCLIWYSLK